MDAGQLKKYRQQLRSRMPLIGNWLQEQAVHSLAEDGSAEAVRVLADAVVRHEDPELANLAVASLERLALAENIPAREAICRLVIHHNHPRAWRIATTRGYVPHEEKQRVVFYFLTGQWAQYESLDFDHRLLREAYEDAEESLRQRIAAQARHEGRLEWVEMVSGGKQGRRLALMSPSEWKVALTVLEESQRWADLWRLAQEAPPFWSAAILRRWQGGKTVLPEADRKGFQELARFARAWKKHDFAGILYHKARLEGHLHEIRCLTMTHQGDLLASGSADYAVHLWSLPDGKIVKKLFAHRDWINALAVTPDDRLLISAGRDKRIGLWRLPEGKRWKMMRGHNKTVHCLAVSPSGDLLASGSLDKTIRLWDLATGRWSRTLSGHEASVSCIAIRPQGDLLASGASDSTVRLWSLPEGKAQRTLTGHRADELDGILALAIDAEGEVLASAGTDGNIRVWSLPGGKHLQTLTGHMGHVSVLTFSPDGKVLVSGGSDRTVRIWRVASGNEIQTIEGYLGEVTCLAIRPDGGVLASSGGGVSGDRSIRLWTLPDGDPLAVLSGHDRPVSCLAFHPEGNLLASGSADGTVCLWSAELERMIHTPAGQSTLQDLEWIQMLLANDGLSGPERQALTYLAALMRWRRRSDIVVEDAGPRVIEVGAFDIEIEG